MFDVCMPAVSSLAVPYLKERQRVLPTFHFFDIPVWNQRMAFKIELICNITALLSTLRLSILNFSRPLQPPFHLFFEQLKAPLHTHSLVDKCKPGVDPRTHYQCDPLWARTSSPNRSEYPGSSRELGRPRSPGNRLDSRWTNTPCPSCGGRLGWGMGKEG